MILNMLWAINWTGFHQLLWVLTGHCVVAHNDCCGRAGPYLRWQRVELGEQVR